MEFITANAAGRSRRVVENGVTYLVAPITSITADGVLPGSRGSLFYPSEETQKAVKAWNGIPIVAGHPSDNMGNHVPAAEIPDRHLGYLRNSRWQGKLQHDAWFDEQRTKALSPDIYDALVNHRQMECSTGLYTTNIPAPNGQATNNRGRVYVAVATNHRPDHMAILVRERGACSIDDGCGLLVNERDETMIHNVSLDEWLDENDMSEDEFEEMAEDHGLSEDEMMERLGITENANPEGINQYSAAAGLSRLAHSATVKSGNKKAFEHAGNAGYAADKAERVIKGEKSASPAKAYSGGAAEAHEKAAAVHGASKKPNDVLAATAHKLAAEAHRGITDNAKKDGTNMNDAARRLILNKLVNFLLPDATDNSNPEGINQYSKGGAAGKTTDKAHEATEAAAKVHMKGLDYPGMKLPAQETSQKAKEHSDVGEHLKAKELHEAARDDHRTMSSIFAGKRGRNNAKISEAHDRAAKAHKEAAEHQGVAYDHKEETGQTLNAAKGQGRHPTTKQYQGTAAVAARLGHSTLHSDSAAPAQGVGEDNGPGDDGRNQTKIERVKPVDVDADDDGPHDDDYWNRVDEEAEHTGEVPPMPSKRSATPTGNANPEGHNQYSGGGGGSGRKGKGRTTDTPSMYPEVASLQAKSASDKAEQKGTAESHGEASMAHWHAGARQKDAGDEGKAEEHTAAAQHHYKEFKKLTGNANPEGHNQYSEGGVGKAATKHFPGAKVSEEGGVHTIEHPSIPANVNGDHAIHLSSSAQYKDGKPTGKRDYSVSHFKKSTESGDSHTWGRGESAHAAISDLKQKLGATANRFHIDGRERVGPCPECGGQISGGVCEDCGHEPTENAEKKKCPECGGEMDEDGECEDCGYTENADETVDVVPQPAPPTPQTGKIKKPKKMPDAVASGSAEAASRTSQQSASGLSAKMAKSGTSDTANANLEGVNQYSGGSGVSAAMKQSSNPKTKEAVRASLRAEKEDTVAAHQKAAGRHGAAAIHPSTSAAEAGEHTKAAAEHNIRVHQLRQGETTNCAMGGPMNDDSAPAGASKSAAMASMDHPPARDAAIAAHDAAQDDDSAGAMKFHGKAAKAHDGAAQDALTDGDQDGVQSHMQAAALHRKAKAMHAAVQNANQPTQEQVENEMGLTLNQIQGMNRDQLLVVLTRNCKCDKEKAAYPSLNTATLRKLVVANAKVPGSNADSPDAGDGGRGMESGGWDKVKGSGGANYENKPGKGLEHDEDDADTEGDFESEEDGGKRPATENSLRRRLKNVDPLIAEMALNHFRDQNDKKRQLILNMMSHINNNEIRNRIGGRLFRKSLAELQEIAMLQPRSVRNARDDYDEPEQEPVANYYGAESLTTNGADELTDNADDDVHCMTAGLKMNYGEISVANGSSEKWKRFIGERNK